MKDNLVIYIHGQGGSISEKDHYKVLFPSCDIIGFDYKSDTVMQAKTEFPTFFDKAATGYKNVYLVANSIGAYFAMMSLNCKDIKKAFFISPVADMEKLIKDMMKWSNVTENELKEKQEIKSVTGQMLSWSYYSYVKSNPINWNINTSILYGEKDNLIDKETIINFSKKINASLTIMPDGEHWFHTKPQMAFLDNWILGNQP